MRLKELTWEQKSMKPMRGAKKAVSQKSKTAASFFLAMLTGVAMLVSCGLFPEASFELAPESRIPNWFHLPVDVPRNAVSVTMDDYIDSSGRWARFTLKTTGGRKLISVHGTMQGSEPQGLKGNLEVVTVNGVVDVVEHREPGPVFYMTDDPAIWKALGLPAEKPAITH